ncbi:MAG: MarR family transcriptional regulator [Caulobacter sp.]
MLEFNNIIRDVERKFKLKCFSPEYEILIILYECGEMHPGDILDVHQSASSTFYSALKRLQDKGLVNSERDALDRRLARYSITDSARVLLDGKRNKVLAWAQERAARELCRPASSRAAEAASFQPSE